MGDYELQIFSERLKELRTELDLTQVQFIEGLGITASALSAYEKNAKNPSISVAKRIAEKYDVSIDWLCGLTDTKKYNTVPKTYKDIIKFLITLDELNLIDGLKFFYTDAYTDNLQTQYPAEAGLSTINNELKYFIRDIISMQNLLKQGTIDEHLYNLWVDDKLKIFDKNIVTWENVNEDTE